MSSLSPLAAISHLRCPLDTTGTRPWPKPMQVRLPAAMYDHKHLDFEKILKWRESKVKYVSRISRISPPAAIPHPHRQYDTTGTRPWPKPMQVRLPVAMHNHKHLDLNFHNTGLLKKPFNMLFSQEKWFNCVIESSSLLDLQWLTNLMLRFPPKLTNKPK